MNTAAAENIRLRLEPVSTQDAAEIYEEYMISDFPPSERKPFAMIRQGMETGEYEFLALRDTFGLAGYAVLVLEQGRKAALLDYYAVVPQRRCSGTGALGLSLLRKYYAQRLDNILIESEHPDEAPNPALAGRRLGFYERAGCRATPIAERLFGVRYIIFSLDCTDQGAARSVQELEKSLREIYGSMIPEPARQKFVRFGDEALKPCPPMDWE